MRHCLDAPDVLGALSKGDIQKANELLKTTYWVQGRVVHGNHLGRTFGFPTANLELAKDKPFLLANGVYTAKVTVDNLLYYGMVNAGVRPTISGRTMTVEVNLFDFSGDLYGQVLDVYFFDRIRDERKFDSLELLVQQIQNDKREAVRLLSQRQQSDANSQYSRSC